MNRSQGQGKRMHPNRVLEQTGSTTNPRTFADLFHNVVTAWIILILSTIITIVSWYYSSQYVKQRSNDRFAYKVEEAHLAIVKRMQEYEQVLRGGIGLFTANHNITRQQWHSYVKTLDIDSYWPGIQGIGFARIVSPEDKSSHEQRIRQKGFPDYTIKPEGQRDIYSAIVYLEPFTKRNQRAFGYDMFSNPVRRKAMSQARDSGQPGVSGLVTLVQEMDKDIQAGFLVYLPLYREGAVLTTLEERRSAIEGFVYSPFRAKDLFQGILGHGDPYLDFQIFDGDSTSSSSSLLYTTLPAESWALAAMGSNHVFEKHITISGHVWTANFLSRPKFEQDLGSKQPLLIAVMGMLVDVLLFLVLRSIAGQKERIQKEAHRIGRELNVAETHSRVLAEEANRTKSEFLANMSHELRTPLNSLLILAKVLVNNEEHNLSKNQIDSAAVIHESGSYLLRLINDILDLSKVEAGRMDLYVDERSFINFAQSIERMFRPVAEKKGLTFEIDIRDDVPNVLRSDWGKVEQIIRNFVSNSLKFTAQGGVTVRVEMPRLEKVFMNADLSVTPCVGITVRDTGIGIPEDKLEQIFDAFRQVDGSTSRQYGGTGLGLSISRKFTNLIGGEIQVKSKKGQGSSFTLYLPLHFPSALERVEWLAKVDGYPEGQVKDARRVVAFQDSSRTILVADDDQRNLFAMKQVLESRVGQVLTANNGRQALDLLNEHPDIDLVFMDIMMPEMNGYEAMQAIREQIRFSKLPIVALTAKAMSGDREQCLEAGASDYLAKPVDEDKLLLALAEWLGKPKVPVVPHQFESGDEIILPKVSTMSHGGDAVGEAEQRQDIPLGELPITVLIVDDDMRSSFSLAQVLQTKVTQVLMVRDGVKALAELEKVHGVSIVLMDIMMPNMDGLEAIREIRKRDDMRHLPIIALTAKTLPEDREKCLEAGANDYLSKPVELDSLLEKMRQWLQVSTGRDTSISEKAGKESAT